MKLESLLHKPHKICEDWAGRDGGKWSGGVECGTRIETLGRIDGIEPGAGR